MLRLISAILMILLLPGISHSVVQPAWSLGATLPANGGQPGRILVVDQSSGQKRHFTIGQEVSRGVVLTRVGNRLALFRIANQDMAIALGQSVPRDPTISVDREWLMALALDVPGLAEQIRLRPVTVSANDRSQTQVDGFLVEWISGDAFNRDLGIRRGDILNRLNNIPLNTNTDVWGLFAELSRLEHIHLHIHRQGHPITLKYQLH